MNQYAKRKIDITFNLGKGEFGDEAGQNVTISGARMSIGLSAAGVASKTSAQFRIFGLPLDMMAQLTRIEWRPREFRANSVLIAAGDTTGPLSVVHMGTIETAFADFNSAPEVAFQGVSSSGMIEAVRPVGARSYIGATDAADVMSDLAAQIGATFERNGVSVILQNPYFPGTAWAQIQACADAARINYSLDRGVLAIWPRNEARQVGGPIRISPATGMVGYPTFNAQGIVVRTLFNKDVVLGSRVDIDTEITMAKGLWVAYGIFHTLESETPNGQWFTDIFCNRSLVNG